MKDYQEARQEMVELVFEGKPKLDPLPWAHLDGETRSDTKDGELYPERLFFAPREGFSQNREDYP